MNSGNNERIKMIYERYHTGKSIILDDLRYLWRKDPEGCAKLTRSILGIIEDKKQETESNLATSIVNAPNVNNEQKMVCIEKEQQEISDYMSSSKNSLLLLNDVRDSMSSIKQLLENMSNQELIELMNHINNIIDSEKVDSLLKYWEDTFEDKLMLYDYESEKKFDILA